MGTQRFTRTLGIAAAALALSVVAVACSFGGGGDEATAVPTATVPGGAPSATSTPAGEASATAISDAVFVNARPLDVIAEPVELPAHLALVVVRNGELWRFHRAANGVVEERLLFDPFAYSSTRLISFWNIHHLGATLPAGQLAIAACSEGECVGLGSSSDDAQVSVFRSRDGGVSWEMADELDGVATIVAGSTLDAFVLQRLARELPAKRAAAIVAESTGLRKNQLYEYLLQHKED